MKPFKKGYQQYIRLYQSHPLKTTMVISFLIPVLLYTIFYIIKDVFPFGDSSMYAIDLDQQYSDFFQYYRTTLLSGDWSAIGHSFTKGLGGGMVGTWSYYLLSPFNLVLLLFPQHLLAPAVSIMMILKLGTTGAAFQYLLGRLHGDANWKSVTYSVSYTLIAFFSVYHMNVIWIDALVFLPFVVWGVEKLTRGGSYFLYTFWLALIIVTNYYMGFMVCIFMVLYFIYAVVKNNHSRKAAIQSIKQFTIGSILAGALTAVVLVPTVHALSISKGAAEAPTLEWTLAYPIQDILSKFVFGAFNLEQLPEGLPNVFIGSLGLIMAICFFFDKAISKRERLTAAGITLFLLLSMNVEALNVLWHGGQYPVWFPYRFSYMFSFLLLLLGYQTFRKPLHFSLRYAVIGVFSTSVALSYLLYNIQTFEFLHIGTIWITFGIVTVMLLVLLLLHQYPKIMTPLLIILAIGELSANTVYNLKSVPYTQQTHIAEYLEKTKPAVQSVAPKDNEFYRSNNLFQRSANDSMQLGYYGLSHFNSTLESSTANLLGSLGIPEFQNGTANVSGSQFTDALFGIRYHFATDPDSHYTTKDDAFLEDLDNYPINYSAQPASLRQDLRYYNHVDTFDDILVYENPNALPLGFAVNSAVSDVSLSEEASPTTNQETLSSAMLGREQKLYEEVTDTLVDVKLENVTGKEKDGTTTYNRNDMEEDASVSYVFDIPTNDPYYLVGTHIFGESIEITVNDVYLTYTKGSHAPYMNNLANQQADETVTFTIHFMEDLDKINVEAPTIVRSRNDIVPEIADELRQQPFDIETFDQSHITGSMDTTTADQLALFTIPYDTGWSAKVNGEDADIFPVIDDSLIALALPEAGHYEIELEYNIPGLLPGLLVSGSALLMYAVLYGRERKKE